MVKATKRVSKSFCSNLGAVNSSETNKFSEVYRLLQIGQFTINDMARYSVVRKPSPKWNTAKNNWKS